MSTSGSAGVNPRFREMGDTENGVDPPALGDPCTPSYWEITFLIIAERGSVVWKQQGLKMGTQESSESQKQGIIYLGQ